MRRDLPLIAVQHTTRPSLLEALFQARRALTLATSDAHVEHFASQMIVQLAGLSECIHNIAETGLLHLEISATSLQTSTHFVDGSWRSNTRVLRLPPKLCSEVKLPPPVCAAIMQSLVIFDAVENDARRELVEIRDMAAVVASGWPDCVASMLPMPLVADMRTAWRQASMPSTKSTPSMGLALALTERLRGSAFAALATLTTSNSSNTPAASGVEEVNDAFELARCALERIAA